MKEQDYIHETLKERLKGFQSNEDFLQFILNNTNELIFELDSNCIFRFVWANDENMLYIQKDQIIGQSISDIYAESNPKLYKMFLECFEYTKHYGSKREIYQMHTNSGLNWYESIFMRKDIENGDYLFFVLVRSIDKIKKIEDELSFNKSMLDQTNSIAKVGGWRYNVEDKKSIWTKETYNIHGVDIDANISVDFSVLQYFDGDKEIIEKSFDDLITHGIPYEHELRMQTIKGNTIWVKTAAQAVYENGKIIAAEGYIQDITNQKKYERELIKAKEEALRANQIKTDFFSMISHEIRTPLNGISGMIEMLFDTNPTSEQVEKLNFLKFSSNQLKGIVNDILDFNKLAEGKVKLESKRINLREVLKFVVQSNANKAIENRTNIVEEYDSLIPEYLIGDSLRIGQILNNLLSNAVKFTVDGSVKVKIKLLDRFEDELVLNISVKDTGIGISEDKLGVIFDKFTQADSSISRRFGGSGLGLSIVKFLCELHNTQITVESKLGEGSNFSFNLKLPIEKETQHEVKKTRIESNFLKGFSVLVVEDNKVNQKIAEHFLIKRGALVKLASNGAEAIQLFNNNAFDLVLMDILLPDMDGFEISQSIKRINSKTPIFSFSALPDNEITEKGKDLISDNISKPIDENEFVAKMTQFLIKSDT